MTCPPSQDQGTSAATDPLSRNSITHTSNSVTSSEHQVSSHATCTEHPIPRLFIILPEATTGTGFHSSGVLGQDRNRTQDRQFRLHFLCESGVHKVQEGSESLLDGKGVHRIHLTNHPGYPITLKSKFLQEHGPSILAMTRVLAMVLRIRLQTPSNRELGLDEPSALPIEPLHTDTLSDPFKMEKFLSFVDKDGAFGNLQRVVTLGGQVQWVCSEHSIQ